MSFTVESNHSALRAWLRDSILRIKLKPGFEVVSGHVTATVKASNHLGAVSSVLVVSSPRHAIQGVRAVEQEITMKNGESRGDLRTRTDPGLPEAGACFDGDNPVFLRRLVVAWLGGVGRG